MPSGARRARILREPRPRRARPGQLDVRPLGGFLDLVKTCRLALALLPHAVIGGRMVLIAACLGIPLVASEEIETHRISLMSRRRRPFAAGQSRHDVVQLPKKIIVKKPYSTEVSVGDGVVREVGDLAKVRECLQRALEADRGVGDRAEDGEAQRWAVPEIGGSARSLPFIARKRSCDD